MPRNSTRTQRSETGHQERVNTWGGFYKLEHPLQDAESVGLSREWLHFQYSKYLRTNYFPFFIRPLRFEVFPERSGQCFMASNRFLVPFRFQDSEDLPVNVAPLRENLKKRRFHRKKWQQYQGRAFSNRKTALLNSSWRLIFPPSQCEGFARDARFRFTYLYVFQGLSTFFANPTQNVLNIWKSV